MFCSKCGTKVRDEAKFCPNCGARIMGIQMPRKPEIPGSDVSDIPAAPFVPVPASPDGSPAAPEAQKAIDEPVIDTKPEPVFGQEEPYTENAEPVTEPEIGEMIRETAHEEIVPETEDNFAEATPEPVTEEEIDHDDAQESGTSTESETEPITTDDLTEVIPEPANEETVPEPEEIPESVKKETDILPQEPIAPAAAAEEDRAETVPGQEQIPPATVQEQQMPQYSGQHMPYNAYAGAPVQDSVQHGTPYQTGGQYVPGADGNMTQAQAYAQYIQSFEPEPPKKKKWWIGLIAAILIVALAGGGAWYFIKVRPEQKRQELIQQYLDEGSSYYEAELYVNAAESYEKVLELDPDNFNAKQNLYASLQGETAKLLLDGRYEEARDAALRMADINGPDETTDMYLNSIYNAWIIECIENGEYDRGLELLDEGMHYLTEDEVSKRAEELAAMKDNDPTVPEVVPPAEEPVPGGEEPEPDPYTLVNDRQSFAERVAEVCDDGHYDSASLLLLVYQDIATDGMKPGYRLTVKLEGYQYDNLEIVMRENDYYVYYGMMNDEGQREGVGWLLSYFLKQDGYGVYFYIAQWEKGEPNGEFYEWFISEDNEIDVYTGQVINGLYDGTITMENHDGLTYYGVFNEGRITELGRTEDNQIVYFATEDSEHYFTVSEEQLETALVGLGIK